MTNLMNLTQGFCLLACIRLLATLCLGWLHSRWVTRHRGLVPHAFMGRVSLAEHQRAADYTVARQNIAQLSEVVSFGLLLVWTFGGGLSRLDGAVADAGVPVVARGIAVVALFSLLSMLIDLPLDVWRTFRLEAAFGFNQTSMRTFVGDKLKALVLGAIIGLPLAAGVLYTLSAAGPFAWLWAWALWSGFSMLMMWAYPALIAPMFNTFRPLEQESVKARIQKLLDRCGFASKGVFVMDGSTRSTHGNAYFTGLGRNKRVVFFDTLLKTLTVEEIEAVLAHELGHFELRHVLMGLVTSIALSGLGLRALQALVDSPGAQAQLGLAQASSHGAVLLFLLWLPVVAFFVSPIGAAISRRHEYAADAFAAQYVDSRALARGLVKLYRENASTLTPHPLYVWCYASHPPAVSRIGRLESFPATKA
jgi:STE24 endopeptidase